MAKPNRKISWKGPTVKEIAKTANAGLATVDRVMNNRPGVSEKTRKRVLCAMEKLSNEHEGKNKQLHIHLFTESGASFNAELTNAIAEVNRSQAGIEIDTISLVETSSFNPQDFSKLLEKKGYEADGVILVAREHPLINSSVRKLMKHEIPVVCLTTDLPSSRRSTYIGNDQYAAGCVAGQLIGNALPKQPDRILLSMSVSFRCQQEREMGFRKVLRTEYPHLKIEERIFSDDDIESTYLQMHKYFAAKGAPAAIYNTAGSNSGIARALSEFSKPRETLFVGHELTANSRHLLQQGLMDYVISHNYTTEVTSAACLIREALKGSNVQPDYSDILIYTKFNCSK